MRILVTTALPYANGDIHLGHLAGCYLPADIYCRYQRSKGRDVIHIGGTDEHGVPITLLAEREKKSPQEIVDFYHKRIKDSFEKFGILFDNFSRTSLPLHHKTSQDFFLKIYEKGYIYPKKVRQFFCPNCGLFLADRYLEETCPHC
ncbi:MAG: class I tRNA ligase family protein, partial [candidate division WOR-3 bacterium]